MVERHGLLGQLVRHQYVLTQKEATGKNGGPACGASVFYWTALALGLCSALCFSFCFVAQQVPKDGALGPKGGIAQHVAARHRRTPKYCPWAARPGAIFVAAIRFEDVCGAIFLCNSIVLHKNIFIQYLTLVLSQFLLSPAIASAGHAVVLAIFAIMPYFTLAYTGEKGFVSALYFTFCALWRTYAVVFLTCVQNCEINIIVVAIDLLTAFLDIRLLISCVALFFIAFCGEL